MNNSQIVVKEKVNYEREEGVPFSHFFMFYNTNDNHKHCTKFHHFLYV